MNAGAIDLVAVNVGPVALLGMQGDKPVLSGIRKSVVADDVSILISTMGLSGDAQADLRAHGGHDKAVYAYPVENLNYWNEEMKPASVFGPGTFGENLTVQGLDEDGVFVGDKWQWGTATLQVSQPRFPCYKLGMATGFPEIIEPFVKSGRTGWYLRVLEPGVATIQMPISLVERGLERVSVRSAHFARLPSAERVDMERVAGATALAAVVRESLSERLGLC